MPSVQDVAMMSLYLSPSPSPLCFLSPSPSPRPTCGLCQPGTPPPLPGTPPPPLRPCLSGRLADQRERKRRVVFADAKGLSLTAVHLFSRFQDEPLSRRCVSAWSLCEDVRLDLRLRLPAADPAPCLALDFAPPSSDYVAFRVRLRRDRVALESATLQGEGLRRALSGTVAALRRRDGARQAVALRVTFDGWRSHRDAPATFMNNLYGCTQDADTFSFVLELPPVDATPPDTRGGVGEDAAAVEFCVRLQAEGEEEEERCYWDNNQGQNYSLRHAPRPRPPNAIPERTRPAPPGCGGGGASLLDANSEFDRFGSPRLSSGMFPEWQSWGHAPTVPYW